MVIGIFCLWQNWLIVLSGTLLFVYLAWWTLLEIKPIHGNKLDGLNKQDLLVLMIVCLFLIQFFIAFWSFRFLENKIYLIIKNISVYESFRLNENSWVLILEAFVFDLWTEYFWIWFRWQASNRIINCYLYRNIIVSFVLLVGRFWMRQFFLLIGICNWNAVYC